MDRSWTVGSRRATPQRFARIAPEGLGHGVAHIFSREPDIGEEVIVLISQRRDPVPVLDCLVKPSCLQPEDSE